MYFQGSQVSQKGAQIGDRMRPKTAKCEKMTDPKKPLKTYRQQVSKRMELVSKWDGYFVAETFPKLLKFTSSQK